LSADLDQASAPSPGARGVAGLLVANTSLLIAVLVYMGWTYDDALYGYFHVRPLDLDVSIIEYMLRSLALFTPGVVVFAAVVVAVTAARGWGLGRTKVVRRIDDIARARISAVSALRWLVATGDDEHTGRFLLIGAGVAVTVIALVLDWSASHVQISTYVVLGFLGSGPLLLTWPTRAERLGRFPYALAIVVAAVCALWAASLYAHGLGTQAAKAFVRNLPSSTAVVVYSTQPLALSGPGVTVEPLPARFIYHYRYYGLRLLTARSGTYYLVPQDWSPQYDLTYILNESDQTRIELLSGVRAIN